MRLYLFFPLSAGAENADSFSLADKEAVMQVPLVVGKRQPVIHRDDPSSRLFHDALAGSGGCVQARVLLRSRDTQTLFESPVITGS